ncbi:coiled-coil domain-containing protein 102A-like [Gossypium hirsutum]|uniref:Coiled-coil domain-containing protein 102A-like n=1 Tax=Gossypium hirsutum TaxID=3635 RepID=A0A1U8L1L7_GOSHI|nr:coiled-coil domain-containing protein 102A-like [Gossypium hirsutum]
MAILQNLQEEDIEWKAPWLLPDEILYRCGNFDWVPLLGIWGAIGYAPLLVLRQYRSRQFIPATQGLAECEFSYGGDRYKKRIREVSNAWNQTRQMKRLAVGPMTTSEYDEWRVRRVNDNISKSSYEGKLEKQIEQIEEEKTNLRLDADVQKLEMERLRKGKARAEEDLDSLKTDYKKLRSSMKTAGLGKTSEQWCKEIQEEKNKADRWERRFQEVQTQNETLKRSLSENQKEKGELENRVSELEESLHRHRNRNSVMELKASLNRIEEMKGRIEELEAALRSCEIRIEHLESNEDRQDEQLHYFQNQVRDRYHIMGEAVLQIQEVADHLQTLAVQADVLSMKYELESSRG